MYVCIYVCMRSQRVQKWVISVAMKSIGQVLNRCRQLSWWLTYIISGYKHDVCMYACMYASVWFRWTRLSALHVSITWICMWTSMSRVFTWITWYTSSVGSSNHVCIGSALSSCRLNIFVHVWMYVCMYVCMYMCVYVCWIIEPRLYRQRFVFV